MKLGALLAAAIGCGAVNSAGAATNLLTNGGFENRNFTGWTLAGDTSSTGVACPVGGSPDVAEGSCSAYLSTFTTGGSLSQSFATTIGGKYTLSFEGLFNGDIPSSFSVTVNGTTPLSFVNPLTTVYQTFVLPFTAVSSSTTLAFSFRDDPGFEYLDNVSVTAAVPEPTTDALLFAGLGMIGFMSRRRGAKPRDRR